MLLHMRTTLNIDDALMRRIRQQALETGRTITDIVEEALRREVAGHAPRRTGFTLTWNPVAGRALPGVDLGDRDSLYQEMERGG